MSTHVETVTRIYEAFGRGDIPTVLDHLADDVAWESWTDNTAATRGVPWMQPRQGKAGAAAFFTGLASQLQVTEFSVLSIMGSGDQVAVELVIAANVLATGRSYRDEEMHLWTFDEAGRVTRLRHYADTAKHIVAAGLA